MLSAPPAQLLEHSEARARSGPLHHSLRVALFRTLLLSVLFGSELIAITIALDGAALDHRDGLAKVIRDWGPWILRGAVGFVAILLTFAFVGHRAELERIGAHIASRAIRWPLLIAHAGALAVFAWISSVLYSGGPVLKFGDSIAGSWLVAGILAILCAALAFAPWNSWIQLLRVDDRLLACALAAAVAASLVGKLSRELWHSASLTTFALTKTLLSPFVSAVLTNPATLSIGTAGFHVRIAPGCSGLEGISLTLAFVTLWLVLFRKECRFPHCLMLIPAAIAISFLLNSFRIATLILIGNAGARDIAVGGFHSQAGWIMFTVVAAGFCLAVRHMPWFTTRPRDRVRSSFANPTAAYLMPFLAILAAGMIAGALSGGFEWLYPFRMAAAAGALWLYRREYSGLNWRFGWLAPIGGVAVFAIWIAANSLLDGNAHAGIPAILIAASPIARTSWIGLRVLAAAVTVPIAEELAFRGFLLRWLVSGNFAMVPFQRFTWMAVILSSAIFGILHGGHWVAGMIAGALFALLVIRRGRIGDAVVAHATANALLAGYVLLSGNWQVW